MSLNTVSFLSPNNYALSLATKNTLDEMDVACEIYIARSRAIYYSDLMDASKDDGLATSRMLTSWLNDADKNGQTLRLGIINLYKQRFSDHFQDGKWQARNMAIFIDYALQCLTDRNLIKDKKRINQFTESIKDEKWFWQAVSIICIKLIEDLFARDSLKSASAKALIDQVMLYRTMINGMAKIVGRVGKTNDSDADSMDQIRETLQEGARQSLVLAIDALGNYEENAIFERHKNAIISTLTQVRESNAIGMITGN